MCALFSHVRLSAGRGGHSAQSLRCSIRGPRKLKTTPTHARTHTHARPCSEPEGSPIEPYLDLLMGKLRLKEESHSIKVSQNWSGRMKPVHCPCLLSFHLLSPTLNPGAPVPVPSVGEVSFSAVPCPGAPTSHWLSKGCHCWFGVQGLLFTI